MLREEIGILLLLTVAGSGCGHDFYAAYRAQHPGWESITALGPGADLAELLAGLHAPNPAYDRTTRNGIRVFRISRPGWHRLPLRSLRGEGTWPRDKESYLVVAQVSCGVTSHGVMTWNSAINWYLLAGNQLAGYRHIRFDPRCGATSEAHLPPGTPASFWTCIHAFRKRAVLRERKWAEDSCGAPPDEVIQSARPPAAAGSSSRIQPARKRPD